MPGSYQHTVAAAVICSGVGLHSGDRVKLTVRPAPAHAGIVFVRTDLSGIDNRVPARADAVQAAQLCTIIANAAGVTVSTIEHLMASSALPFLFPATPLWVDGQREFFGDGSMRQVSPLSQAMHLGAHKVLVIGVGQPQRSQFGGGKTAAQPSLGAIAGHAMASVFHDTLQADVEQAQRVTQTLQQLPREIAAVLPYRPVEVLAIQPTQSLDEAAHAHVHELPLTTRRALGGVGALKGGGAALASYLLFEPGFVSALIAMGERDALERREELLAFLG